MTRVQQALEMDYYSILQQQKEGDILQYNTFILCSIYFYSEITQMPISNTSTNRPNTRCIYNRNKLLTELNY